jgi:hypothetical protein
VVACFLLSLFTFVGAMQIVAKYCGFITKAKLAQKKVQNN